MPLNPSCNRAVARALVGIRDLVRAVALGMSERAVGGRPISGNDRPSRSFKAGRICRENGCETILSIYNNGSFCSQHEPMTVPRTRGRKIA